ncbi:hypothetical protein IC614_03030 [Allosphingosinicella flava]|uniref:Uncharacterized protein n=1 Tax=Allosphingosinicella flava TaxID=2771430 RepID=A0A7T2GKL1_9SPHN|nr:hypothetical protein IC614_03030 [Sphingosinicella flava]
MSVVQLHQPKPREEVVSTLRRIADELENGALEWPVTTAVLICGHSDAEIPMGDGTFAEQNYWTTYAMGPRSSSFTVRGLVASAMRQWNHGDD